MPYINLNGQLIEVTQEQFDIYNIGQNQSQVGTTQSPAEAAAAVAAGGTVTVTPTGTAQILTPDTTNNTPGQPLTTSYQQVATVAADTTTADYTVNAQDTARAELTADQLTLLGAADAADPFIRANLGLPPLSEIQTLSGAIGNVNFDNIGNVVTTAISDIKDTAVAVGNAISDLFSSGTPNTVPDSSVNTSPATSNAGASIQTFDDGTTLQTFDDGSILATGTDGSLTSTDALVDNTQGYGQITDSAPSASSVDTAPAPTNYGTSTQTFDDGTTIQTFDDGSVLATGVDGSITSSPAPTNSGTTTQIFDDGSVLTTNADGSISATDAIEGSNIAESSADVQAKAREGLTAEQLTALGGADATDPYIRARLDLPPLTTQPNLVNALTSNTPEPTPDTVSASDVNTAPAETTAGTTTQTFDDGTTLQTFDDGSVLATGIDGSVTSSPAPTEAGTTTTVDETNGTTTQTFDDGTQVTTVVPEDTIINAPTDVSPTIDPEVPALVDTLVPDTQVVYDAAPTDAGATTTVDDTTGTTTQTNGAGEVAVTDIPPSEVVYDAGNIDSAVDPQSSLAPGESIVPENQIDVAPDPTNYGTTTQTFDDGTTIQTFDDGSVITTDTDGTLAATDAPVDNTQGYGQFTDTTDIAGSDIASAPTDTNFGTSIQTFDDGTTLQTFDDGSVLATDTNGDVTSSPAPVDAAEDPYAVQDAENGANAGTGTTNTGTGTSADSAAASANIQGLVKGAQQQKTIADQRKQINNGDWRVRLRLAPQAKYLYNAPNPGILKPLQVTDGIIFPYTPAIQTAYRAQYTPYDLTHSNYRGYWYQNSYVNEINLTATFTAQDTNDANYLLAVIHFLRSATKMFYGQDAERGTPPPLVYLSGLGDYQFREHACAISSFNYNLPADVDYIRAGSPNNAGLNFNNIRDRQSVATNSIFGTVNRLAAAFLTKGAITGSAAPPTLGLNRPTYVPTKMEIQLTLLPVQSRQQVSKQFSLKEFANGNLLKGGFW